MSDPYGDMLSGFDDVEESHGFSGEPLPTDFYALKVEKVLDTNQSEKGALTARLQLQVTEGVKKDQRAFVTVVMGPSSQNPDGSMRSEAELKKATTRIQQLMKGMLSALGVPTGQPVGESYEKVFSFYNVGAWEGREFVGKVRLQPAKGQYAARNNLDAHFNLDDEKKGIAWLREQHSEAASGVGDAATV